jgi:ATP-dependent exoDNAse (exonuclease V) beta subunit
MKEFERDFHISKIIKLEQNYRSHGNILRAANTLIRNNSSRLGKNLWTSEGQGELIRVYNALTDIDEAAFVVDEVKSLHAEGIALSQMALLYRSNAQSRVLEHALFNAALAYRVYGGMRFFERQEIKHALAYLRLIANPNDNNALLRIVNFPARGIGARSLEQVQDEASRQGMSLWSAMLERCGRTATRPAGSQYDISPGKEPQPFVLQAACILKFIHENMDEARPVMLTNNFVACQQFIAAEQQFGKIHNAFLVALVFVGQIKFNHLAGKIVMSLDLGSPKSFVFRIIDEPLDLARRKLFLIRAQALQRPLDEGQLIGGIQNLKSLRQTCVLVM